MTEAMPFLQKYDITFLRPPTILVGFFRARLDASSAAAAPASACISNTQLPKEDAHMRASTDFLLREIAGEFMLVPVGPGASGINGLVTLNEIGAFLFKALQTDQSLDSLTEAVVSEYDVAPETARADAADFLRQLSEIGALDQTDD